MSEFDVSVTFQNKAFFSKWTEASCAEVTDIIGLCRGVLGRNPVSDILWPFRSIDHCDSNALGQASTNF